jgi:phosphohistidine phosphatase
MDLYIIRHGLAHPLGQKNDFTDEKRTLTAQGRDRMREVARGLRKLEVRPDMILSSPLARARETAEIIADSLGLDGKMLLLTANLSPGFGFDSLLAEIKDKHVESIALVGHEPDLGELAGLIISGDTSVTLPLRKGGACCINVAETVPSFRGTLVWLLTPKQLRIMGK